jgi:lipopolysaccharide transport system ATP-binding protein
MALAVRVSDLSKSYRLGGPAHYRTLRESISSFGSKLLRRDGANGSAHQADSGDAQEFWALRDVSFDVASGEIVGIIGRNGAGKSTLLKILSRITQPTRGSVEVIGRVGSLLEVGTGFHPELSGRENIYLNGAILGMSHGEIARKFDEIVAFAEVERFLDTPVKRYSSGMYTRLAFAVAAYLEPEVLVVDEVLAVGDAAFQKRCLGRMDAVARSGRTILFVSHNMRAVQQLCTRAIWLDRGKVREDGPTNHVVASYLRDGASDLSKADVADAIAKLPADPAIAIRDVGIFQENLRASRVGNGEEFEVRVRYEVLQRTIGLRVFFDLVDREDTILFRTFIDDDADMPGTLDRGEYVSSARVPANLLAPGDYEVHVYATIFNIRMCTPQPIRLSISVDPTGRVNRAYVGEPARGKLLPHIPWTTSRTDSMAGQSATRG